MKQVFVIDPGMMEAGGHHAALLETIISSIQMPENYAFFVNKQLDKSFENKAQESGVSIFKHFESYFYEYYDSGEKLRIAGCQNYIRRLASEYLSVLQSIRNSEKNSEIVCFYPCLNWEHALALWLAIKIFDSSVIKIKHKVCCMFTPDGGQQSTMNPFYRMAFNSLSSLKTVELFATEQETADYFEWLEVSTKGLHPCYLLPWSELRGREFHEIPSTHILLYMGDAKKSKGFLDVPEVASNLIKQHGPSLKITIQFTIAWDSLELYRAKDEILSLAAKYSNIEVCETFWSTNELVNKLSSITQITCTYDTKVYANKSSGLLWLACFFDIPIILSDSCWLDREAARLSHQYVIDRSLLALAHKDANHSADNNYKNAMFENLYSWLQK